ncbi:hypothetical protein [Paenibacillus ottowii]
MKKYSVLPLSFALMFSLTSVSFAENGSVPSNLPSTGSTIEVGSSHLQNHDITPFDRKLIDSVRHTGGSAYTKTLTLHPEDGKTLNLAIANAGSASVYVQITVDGKVDYSASRSIAAGKSDIISWTNFSGPGLSGTYEIYIYNKDGSNYNLSINARQV